MNDLYQIGMPVERLSSAFMLWTAYERPCVMVVYPAKTEEWAVVELRDTELAAAIIETVRDCRVEIVKNMPVKHVKI